MKLATSNRKVLGSLLFASAILLGLLMVLWQQRTAGPPPLILAGTPLPTPAAPISAQTAGRVGPLARWGDGTIYHVAWSPDGTFVATATSLGVELYDAHTLQPVR